MTRNQIEAFTSRWLAGICTGNVDEFSVLVAPRVLDQNSGQETNQDSFRARARAVYEAFEALEGRVDELLIDGDKIAWRWTLIGVQRAPFLGECALGKRVTLSGTNFQRLEAGVVVAHYTLIDAVGILRQLRSSSP
jgi:predicted ester cyclase